MMPTWSLAPGAPSMTDAFSRKFATITDATTSDGAVKSTLASRQESFSQAISRAANRLPLTKEAKARQTAQQFVASSLVEPILKQMRSSENVAPPLGPSKAEQQFRSLMDTQIAQNIVKRSHWPVVDRIAKDLLNRSPGVTA